MKKSRYSLPASYASTLELMRASAAFEWNRPFRSPVGERNGWLNVSFHLAGGKIKNMHALKIIHH
jgi:hypothetical protein